MPDTEIVEDWFGRYYSDKREGGEPVRRFTLSNHHGLSVQVITYGGTVTSLRVPDHNGKTDDVVLGFDSVNDYYDCTAYIGATVGRVANRIAHGRFVLNNKGYLLATNSPPNHLHGGIKGYDKMLWESHVQGHVLTLSHTSRDGEEGYPGESTNHVTFQLTNDDELVISYLATTTKACPISLTNHSYFNLAGHNFPLGLISDHVVTIYAEKYTPTDSVNIPTGELVPVEGTLFDLRNPVKLGDRIDAVPGNGFDHNFCLHGDGLRPAARVVHPPTGRVLDVSTTLPGLQFYTSNFFPTDESLKGKYGAVYRRHSGFCLETQQYPNAVNQHNFPTCVLNPGETYEHTTIYKFSTTKAAGN